MQPLELVVQGDFVWSYGGCDHQIPIPEIMNEIAAEYEFIGVTGDRSIATDILSLLLNMHDYNHQNGTHRELFEIEEVEVKQFVDEGLHSHAYLSQPRKQPTWRDILKNPAQMAMPKVLEAHARKLFSLYGIDAWREQAAEFERVSFLLARIDRAIARVCIDVYESAFGDRAFA